MEFHISRQARRRYRFEDSLFSYSGHVIFANFHAARVFAGRMNERRQGAGALPGISAGQVNALGLIDEIMHHMVALYRSQEQPALYDRLEAFLTEKLGRRRLQAAVRAFVRDFPPPAVYQGRQDAAAFLASENDGIPNRQAAIEEILMLWLANANPACETFLELFDHRALAEKTAYLPLVDALHGFFETQPRFGPDDQNLVDMLRSPAIAVPDSLQGQLEYIRRRWGSLLALALLGKLLLEHGWSSPVVWDSANEMSVVQAAHLSGAFWGLLLGLAAAWRRGPGALRVRPVWPSTPRA